MSLSRRRPIRRESFRDIRQQGIVLFELDSEPLVEPRPIGLVEQFKIAREHYESRLPHAIGFLSVARFCIAEGDAALAAFQLHQAIEHAYSTVLLVLENYGPPTHNLPSLRGFAEGMDRRLADAWPHDRQRHSAWFNTINEAYVKARPQVGEARRGGPLDGGLCPVFSRSIYRFTRSTPASPW
ncbi:HEPN domain-containing protein [Ensifer oleiphilus]|uniref:HEPN domain-containing protein n=1 Tax=Ensifer oleiphilus TaxID=2742698 RepID=UPI0031B84A62